jgi:hypothetical protein
MKMNRRVERLEHSLPPAADDRWQQCWDAVVDRFAQLVLDAEPLLVGDEQQRVGAALGQLVAERIGPLSAWLWHLREGWCRLPELSLPAMKDLLVAWVSPEAAGSRVCNRCGLDYPKHQTPMTRWQLLPGKQYRVGPPPWFDLPDFFTACPSCGNSVFDVDSPHRTERTAHAWKELDGFVGDRMGAGTVH